MKDLDSTSKTSGKRSQIGQINIPIVSIRPTQFQIYLDRVYNSKTQEGLIGLIHIILSGNLIIPSPKQDPQGIINRRENRYFSDLARLITFQDDPSIYAIAGTHRLIAIFLANQLYRTRNYLDAKEYDLAKIRSLREFNLWRKEEFVLQKIKGCDQGHPYKGFDYRKYQKGFDSQFTAENGGKRIFIKKCVSSWKELVSKNASSMTQRLKYLISKGLIDNKTEIHIAKDIIKKFAKQV